MNLAGSLPTAPPTLPLAARLRLRDVMSASSFTWMIDLSTIDTPAKGVTPTGVAPATPAVMLVVPEAFRIAPLSNTSDAEFTETVPVLYPMNWIAMG